jgi:hypothetical protein
MVYQHEIIWPSLNPERLVARTLMFCRPPWKTHIPIGEAYVTAKSLAYQAVGLTVKGEIN